MRGVWHDAEGPVTTGCLRIRFDTEPCTKFMTCHLNIAEAEILYAELVRGLVRARQAADDRNLDPDEVCTWMTTSMMAAVRPATADHCLLGVGMFHGHQVRLLKGPEMIAFSAHPKLV